MVEPTPGQGDLARLSEAEITDEALEAFFRGESKPWHLAATGWQAAEKSLWRRRIADAITVLAYPVPAGWRCPECRCHGYARVEERKSDGRFGPGRMIRCVECKRTYDLAAGTLAPLGSSAASVREAVEALRAENRELRAYLKAFCAATIDPEDRGRDVQSHEANPFIEYQFTCLCDDDPRPDRVITGGQVRRAMELVGFDKLKIEPADKTISQELTEARDLRREVGELRAALARLHPAPAEDGGKALPWRKMFTDRPSVGQHVVVRRPADWGYWYGTLRIEERSEDGHRLEGDTVLHYNGNALVSGFRGASDMEWLPCEALAAAPAPAPEAGERGQAETLDEACKPWRFHHGDPPSDDSPLSCVFGAGMAYTEALLAKHLGVGTYEGGDGSEDFDQDATKTLENILVAAGLYDPEDGRWATLSSAPREPEQADRDQGATLAGPGSCRSGEAASASSSLRDCDPSRGGSQYGRVLPLGNDDQNDLPRRPEFWSRPTEFGLVEEWVGWAAVVGIEDALTDRALAGLRGLVKAYGELSATRVSDEPAKPEDAQRLSPKGASAVGEAETPKPETTTETADSGRPAAGSPFRTGHRYPRNVYEGDVGLFMASDEALARRLVELLNIGAATRAAAARPAPGYAPDRMSPSSDSRQGEA